MGEVSGGRSGVWRAECAAASRSRDHFPGLLLVDPACFLHSDWTRAKINRSGLGKPTSYKCGVKCRVEKSIARQKVIGPNKKISLRD